jgi:transposase
MVSMRKSRLSPTKQNRLMEHFVAGATTLVGVNSKTAVYYFHRLLLLRPSHILGAIHIGR